MQFGFDEMEDQLVSVVILTWERKEDVLSAVRSVYTQDYKNVEVIAFLLQQRGHDGCFDEFVELMCSYFHGRGGATRRRAGPRRALAHQF